MCWLLRPHAAQAQSSSSSFANAGSSGSASSGSAASAPLQLPSIPSPPANALYGSVTTAPPSSAVLPLSLDDAIRRGLQHNLQMAIGIQNQRLAAGERLEAVYYLMPSITWQAERSRNQINLAAEGFRPSIFSKFPSTLFPPSALANFPNVVTANVVSAQATLRQTLFDLKSFELYRAAKQEILAVNDSVQSSRQDVIQTVADSYLVALADAANVANAKSLLATNAEILRETALEHQAGTVAKLDELRARVQYQQQQQVVIAQQDTLEKAKVALNREIGLAADQPIELTDETPFETLDVMPLNEALQEAYANRQDYRQLQAELRSAEFQRGAARLRTAADAQFRWELWRGWGSRRCLSRRIPGRGGDEYFPFAACEISRRSRRCRCGGDQCHVAAGKSEEQDRSAAARQHARYFRGAATGQRSAAATSVWPTPL